VRRNCTALLFTSCFAIMLLHRSVGAGISILSNSNLQHISLPLLQTVLGGPFSLNSLTYLQSKLLSLSAPVLTTAQSFILNYQLNLGYVYTPWLRTIIDSIRLSVRAAALG
jgi:hypothetical protein